MDRYLFTIGDFKVEWYSVLIIVGAFLAIIMIMKEAKRHNYPTDFVFNMCFWAIIKGTIIQLILFLICVFGQ